MDQTSSARAPYGPDFRLLFYPVVASSSAREDEIPFSFLKFNYPYKDKGGVIWQIDLRNTNIDCESSYMKLQKYQLYKIFGH